MNKVKARYFQMLCLKKNLSGKCVLYSVDKFYAINNL